MSMSFLKAVNSLCALPSHTLSFLHTSNMFLRQCVLTSCLRTFPYQAPVNIEIAAYLLPYNLYLLDDNIH